MGRISFLGTGQQRQPSCIKNERFRSGRTTDDAKQTCLGQISGTDDAAKTARAACEATALSTASPQYPLQQGDRLVQRPCEDAADSLVFFLNLHKTPLALIFYKLVWTKPANHKSYVPTKN